MKKSYCLSILLKTSKITSKITPNETFKDNDCSVLIRSSPFFYYLLLERRTSIIRVYYERWIGLYSSYSYCYDFLFLWIRRNILSLSHLFTHLLDCLLASFLLNLLTHSLSTPYSSIYKKMLLNADWTFL